MWTHLRTVLYVAIFALHLALVALAAFLCWKDVTRLLDARHPFWENVRDSYEGEPGLMFCGLSEIFGNQWSYSKIWAVLTDDLILRFIECCDKSWECSSRTPIGGGPLGIQASLTWTHRLQTGFWVLSAVYLVCWIVYLVYWLSAQAADKRTTEAAEALTAQDFQTGLTAFAQKMDAMAVNAPVIVLTAPAPVPTKKTYEEMTSAERLLHIQEERQIRKRNFVNDRLKGVIALKGGEVP